MVDSSDLSLGRILTQPKSRQRSHKPADSTLCATSLHTTADLHQDQRRRLPSSTRPPPVSDVKRNMEGEEGHLRPPFPVRVCVLYTHSFVLVVVVFLGPTMAALRVRIHEAPRAFHSHPSAPIALAGCTPAPVQADANAKNAKPPSPTDEEPPRALRGISFVCCILDAHECRRKESHVGVRDVCAHACVCIGVQGQVSVERTCA